MNFDALITFQASVATWFLASFFLLPVAKYVWPSTSSLMVYSVFLNVRLSFCQVSRTFSEMHSKRGSGILAVLTDKDKF